MDSYRTVDLFCGAGGITEGFRQQGNFKCVCANDYDENAKQTFQHNHPLIPYIFKDVREVSEEDLRIAIGKADAEVDVITGGPPCQGFSLAGQRLTDDPRNSLFKEYIRITKFLNPKVIFFENVSGIISMQGGSVLKAILAEFQSAGYDCEYKMVNAADYGVPQARPRFVLLGVKAGHGVKLSFPPATHAPAQRAGNQLHLFTQNLLPYVSVNEALSDLPVIDQGEGEMVMQHPGCYHNEYQKERRGSRNPGMLFSHKATRHSKEIQHRYSLIPQGCTNAVLPEEIRTKKINVYKLDSLQPARTVTCNFRTDLLHPTQNRGLTVREAARLQSFDDDYEFFGCLSRKAKWLTQDDQVGNAVPPLMAKAFAEHLAKVILPQFKLKRSNG